MSTSPRALVSENEFLALPESGEKVELLDGEVVESPSPSFWHQETLRRLLTALGNWADGRAVTIGQSPLDVRFGEGRILQPDACVFLETIPRDHEGPIDVVPSLCIEVISTNRTYDRVTKRYVYSEAGVAEYWVVEPDRYVERWHGPQLRLREEVRGQLTTPLLDGFDCDLAKLFA